ncbi:MAG: hypothetical protein ACKVPJ_04685 [Chitinophagales bacterium]
MLPNFNHQHQNLKPSVLFVDMNSFFATCEQQVNYWLRHRPVGVCVYTGQFGCVISSSIEAKKKGIGLGLRLDEAMKICPELVPLETHPTRYREFHVKIMEVLKKYSDNVIPKSIDEAIVNLNGYDLIYKDTVAVAKQIQQDIKNEVGDYLKCSIGVAPNAFLAKLGSDIGGTDEICLITPDNIDEHLSKLKLTDLPGIADGMSKRLIRGGIHTPLELRYASAERLKRVCKSIVGLHWNYRLNFREVDMQVHGYKNMQNMRQVSKEQRKNIEVLNELFLSLCMTLERRMVRNSVFAKKFGISCSYEETGWYTKEIKRYDDHIITSQPIQSGIEIMQILRKRMEKHSEENNFEDVINKRITSIGVWVSDFVEDKYVQYSLFGNKMKEDTLRKTVYSIKDKFGTDKIIPASELSDEPVLKDVIGFGSIKDLHDDISFF